MFEKGGAVKALGRTSCKAQYALSRQGHGGHALLTKYFDFYVKNVKAVKKQKT